MTKKQIKVTLCPCRSGKEYKTCCQPFHLGKLPETALQLMRSRYAAYALCLPDYIIHTTHPASPQFCHDKVLWIQNITEFSSRTLFKDLEILEFQDNDPSATVTFFAHLFQGNKNVSFTEKSYFEKIQGKWLYHNGQFIQYP